MTEQGNTQDLSALEGRLAALRTDMDAALSGANRRRTMSLVVAIIAIVVAFVYMTYISSQLTQVIQLTSINKLADTAEDRLTAIIDDRSQELTQKALAYAPKAADQLEEQIMNAPGDLSDRLRTLAKDQLTARVRQIEPQIVEALKGVLDDALTNAGGKKLTEEEFQAMLRQVSRKIAGSGWQAIAELREVYHTGGEAPPGADDFLAYFNLLAENKGLTARQVHHRAVVLHTLAVLAMYHQQAGGAVSGAPDQPNEAGLANWYDTGTGRLYGAKGELLAPMPAPSGAEGVKAIVCTRGSPENKADRFIAYLEKYTPQGRAQMQAVQQEHPGDFIEQMTRIAAEEKLVKAAQGGQWVPAGSAEGKAVMSAAQGPGIKRCGSYLE